MNHKLKFYEVQPKYFKDNSGNGTGDLIGLSNKMDYFTFLGVDAIILSDSIATQPGDLRKDYKMVTKGIGSISDLQRVISIAKNKKIKVIIDLNIGSIDETHNWFNAASSGNVSFEEIVDFKHDNSVELKNNGYKYKYNEKTKSYYVVNTKTHEINLNWASKETMNKFLEVIKFWHKIGVSGFALTNFEKINNDQDELMSAQTVSELAKLYSEIKKISNDIIVIGKTDLLIPSLLSDLTKGDSKLFDYTQTSGIARLGTSDKFGADVIGKFSQSKLVKRIKKHIEIQNDILTFGSVKFGRITSRWGDEGQYVSESAKTLGMLLLSSSSASSIYYGDELGTKNIGLTKLEDFLDTTINERKRSLADYYGISEEKFMEAQTLQNTINAKSLMAWNANTNGGFSNAKKTVTPVSDSYRAINVETQFKDEHSPLNFHKKLISLSKKSEISDILNLGSYKIKVQKLGAGVIEVVRNYKNTQLCFYINLSNKEKSLSVTNSKYLPKEVAGKVILSTYGYKKYSSVPNKLQPFESILVSRTAPKAISGTQNIKKKPLPSQKILNNNLNNKNGQKNQNNQKQQFNQNKKNNQKKTFNQNNRNNQKQQFNQNGKNNQKKTFNQNNRNNQKQQINYSNQKQPLNKNSEQKQTNKNSEQKQIEKLNKKEHKKQFKSSYESNLYKSSFAQKINSLKKYFEKQKSEKTFDQNNRNNQKQQFNQNEKNNQKQQFNQNKKNNQKQQFNQNKKNNQKQQINYSNQKQTFNKNGEQKQFKQFNKNEHKKQFKSNLYKSSFAQKINSLKKYVQKLKTEKQRLIFELKINHSTKVMHKKMNSIAAAKEAQNLEENKNANKKNDNQNKNQKPNKNKNQKRNNNQKNGKPNNNWNQKNGKPNNNQNQKNGKPNNNWNQKNGKPNQNEKQQKVVLNQNNDKSNKNVQNKINILKTNVQNKINALKKDKSNINLNNNSDQIETTDSQLISKQEQKQLKKTQQILKNNTKTIAGNNVEISKKEQKLLENTQKILVNKEKLSKQHKKQLKKTQEILINQEKNSKNEKQQFVPNNDSSNDRKQSDESSLTQKISNLKKGKNNTEQSSEKLWLNEALEFIRSERKRAAEEEKALKLEEKAAKAKEKAEYKRRKQEEKNKNE